MNNLFNPEDIIEYTLQFGVNYTQNHFGISREEVLKIVKPFTDELDNLLFPCTCTGNMICFMCEKRERL